MFEWTVNTRELHDLKEIEPLLYFLYLNKNSMVIKVNEKVGEKTLDKTIEDKSEIDR